MAVTADSVVVKLTAEVDEATGKVRKYAADFEQNMSRLGSSAERSDLVVRGASAGIVRSAGQMANGTRNFGRQVADLGVQAASGTSPFLIFAQQAPQLAEALSDMGGRGARVAAFFAGPWGAALLAAGSVLSVLGAEAFKAGDTVESLGKKLEENAAKARLTAQAQKIFEASLYGAADASAKLNEKLQEQNKSQLQVAQSALAAASALRQQSLQNLRSEASKAAIAQATARASADPTSFNAALPLAARQVLRSRADRDLVAANERVRVANKALLDSTNAVVEAKIPLLDMRAAAASDASAAATSRHARAIDGLRDAYRKASLEAAKLPDGPARNGAIARANSAYFGGATAANNRLSAEQKAISGSKNKGRSAESIARAAEAARIREVRDNEAFAREQEQLNQGIIDAKRATETDIGKLAQYARDDVASELKKRLASIDADESAKKYDAAQADTLRELAKRRAALQEENITTGEIRRLADEANSVQSATLRNQQDLLQAQGGIAETNAERRRIELELLDLKYKELEIAQKAITNDATGRYTTAQRQNAQDRLDALPGLKQAEQTGIDQRGRGRFEQYRMGLNSVDMLQDSIDGVKIDALEAVTDELTNAAKSALGLKGALGDIVGELIKIGIQRAIIGPLSDAIFGPAGGGGGDIGSLVSSIFGRASGGYVGAGQLVRVNEGASPGNVEGWRPMGSGTVIPLGQMKAAQPRAQTVVQHISVDGRNSVTPASFARDILSQANGFAVDAGKAAYQKSMKDAPARINRFRELGS